MRAAGMKAIVARSIVIVCAAVLVGACAAVPERSAGTVERLYAFNCGESTVRDMSRWTPGVNVGRPGEFSANCYVIRHARGIMVWDSGINDSVAAMPTGFQRNATAPHYILKKPFRDQLVAIGIRPDQVTHAAYSHTHGDHVGNANLFTSAQVYMQQAEYDVMFAPDASTKWGFEVTSYDKLDRSRIVKLAGDYDVFGDGSVMILSTPGHTPGHQSLFVRLPRRGPVILSGDMVHLQDNWNNRRVPSFNYDREQSLKSMEKIAAVIERTHAELWINHDKAQSDGIPKAPAYIE